MYYGVGFVLYCIICGMISKYINESKGYANGFAWGAWFGIIGILVVLCKPNLPPEPEEVTAWSDEVDPLQALEHLSELHDRGIITDDEFEDKKAKLLDKI